MMDNTPRPALPRGPSSVDKRRNRRRKSKYARPLFSLAHGTVLLQAVLFAGFGAALLNELTGGGGGGGAGGATQGGADDPLAGLNLPGEAAPARRRMGPPGFAQLLLWAYLFGTPALFALQRGVLWRRMITSMRLASYTLAGIWFSIVVVFLVLVNQS